MSGFVTDVKAAAVGLWPSVLSGLGIDVPPGNRHGPCPACGHTDTFRFDDKEGRGTWFCGQSDPSAGNGLDLVAKVHDCDGFEAAKLVAPLVGIVNGKIDPKQAERNRRKAKERAEREQEKKAKQAQKTTERVARIWDASQEVTIDNLYLVKKGVGAHGARALSTPEKVGGHSFASGSLIVPCRNAAGELVAIELIDTQAKCALGPKSEGRHIIGPEYAADGIYVTEGYSDAATIHEATGCMAAVAFGSGSIGLVAEALQAEYPDRQIIIAADNDHQEEAKSGKNAGLVKGRAAAKKLGLVLVYPPFEADQKGSDWNDYAALHGLEATGKALIEIKSHPLYVNNYTNCTNTSEGPMNAGKVGGTDSSIIYDITIPTDTTSEPIPENIEESTVAGWQLANSDKDLPRLIAMNRDYCHTTFGGRHVVAMLKPCPVNGTDHAFEALSEFHHYFRSEPRVGLTDPESRKTIYKTLGNAWLDWSGKAYFPAGMGFYPDEGQRPEKKYNLYTGLALKPKEGDCSPWLAHVYDVICAGDSKVADYLLKWFAHLIQKPEEKPSVAVVLKSAEGAGKGTLVTPLLRILGQHGIQVNGGHQIAGKFNATMVGKLLVFADEVDLTDKPTADRLKGIISETTINLERKGKDPELIPNYARLIFASNHDQVIRAGSRERRYLLLEPCEKAIQDTEYFDRLWAWINSGGPAHLLHLLLNLSLEGFNPRKCPVTPALMREKLDSLAPVEQYILEQLESGQPFGGDWRVYASDLVSGYLSWCAERAIDATAPQARNLTGRRMSRMGIEVQGRSDRGEGKFYELPELDQMKLRFAAMLGSLPEELF